MNGLFAKSVRLVSSTTARVAFLFFVATGSAGAAELFPRELVDFAPFPNNPVLEAGGAGHWDVKIRERGWILRDGDQYHMWFTGYDGTREGQKLLGHATSKDGLNWNRDPKNPIYTEHWVEDMMVVKREGTFYMFCEGERDRAQLLTSPDGVDWKRVGTLDVRQTNGEPISEGAFGTPTVFQDGDTWWLFYERGDLAVWAATSTDLLTWTNVQDEPVLLPGPDEFDRAQIAVNQIIKYAGKYYAYLHGSALDRKPALWATGIAVSDDLLHWTKYSGNPLLPIPENKSSGILVHDGTQYRLYTMHGRVDVHFPRAAK